MYKRIRQESFLISLSPFVTPVNSLKNMIRIVAMKSHILSAVEDVRFKYLGVLAENALQWRGKISVFAVARLSKLTQSCVLYCKDALQSSMASLSVSMKHAGMLCPNRGKNGACCGF